MHLASGGIFIFLLTLKRAFSNLGGGSSLIQEAGSLMGWVDIAKQAANLNPNRT